MSVLASGTGGVGTGFLGFLIVAGLAVGLFLLIKSMNRHLKKVPPSFDAADGEASPRDAADRTQQSSAT